VAWNGTNFGTFFVSYKALMFRELSSSLAFADRQGAYYAMSATPNHADLGTLRERRMSSRLRQPSRTPWT
jgi:hypothetical protein